MFSGEQSVFPVGYLRGAKSSKVEKRFETVFYVLTFGVFRCKGLILLETYSALEEENLLKTLPSFLNIEKEVTGNPDYSMYNLSLREDWKTSKKFFKSIMDTEDDLDCKQSIKRNGVGGYNGKAMNGKA